MPNRSWPKFSEEEHETWLHWDYKDGVLKFCTTKEVLFNSFEKATAKLAEVEVSRSGRTICVPIHYCKKAKSILKRILSPEQKKVMVDRAKAIRTKKKGLS